MWYGKHAPAPASKVHPIHRSSSETQLPRLTFSWAPLEEPARRRREKQLQQEKLRKRKAALDARRAANLDGSSLGPGSPAGRLSSGLPSPHNVKLDPLTPLGKSPSSPALGSPASPAGLRRPMGTLEPLEDPPRVPGSAPLSPKSPLLSGSADSGAGISPTLGGTPSSASPPATSPKHGERANDQASDSPSKAESSQSQPSSKISRNSLCAKLLQAKLGGKASDKVRQAEETGEHLSTSANRIETVFMYTNTGGEMTVGKQLQEAMILLDYPYPGVELLQDVLREHAGGRESLDRDDFVVVVQAYEAKVRNKTEEVFKAYSNDEGNVRRQDLVAMLDEAGVSPMTGMQLECTEGLESVDQEEEVDREEFLNVFTDVISRAGLTEIEYERLHTAFEDVEEPDGLISMQACEELLSWQEHLTRLAGGQAAVKALAQEAVRRSIAGTVDLSLQGWVDAARKAAEKGEAEEEPGSPNSAARCTGTAFLAAARALHEVLARNLEKVVAGMDLDTEKVKVEDVIRVLEEIGFLGAMPTTLQEFLVALRLDKDPVLTFPQLYMLIWKYCLSNGFTDEEENDIKEVFLKFDADGSGSLELDEIGPIIRYLGYQPTQYRIYSFAEDFGLYEGIEIDHAGFRRLIANYQAMNLAPVRRVFASGDLEAQELPSLMNLTGYETTEEEIDSLRDKLGGRSLLQDFSEFKKIERIHRNYVRDCIKRNSGVTNQEYRKYKEYFESNDPNSQGYITQKAMRDLLTKLFPDSGLNQERHVRIGQMVKEADADGNGQFDWEEFLWLMQKVTEEMDRDNLVKGLRLKGELGYSSAEVKQWKDLYQISDEDMSGSIDIDELTKLLENLVEMEPQAERELKQMWAEIDDGDGELDFWEFLRFMRTIQDRNWRNINGAAGR